MYRIIIKRTGTNAITGKAIYRADACFTAYETELKEPVNAGWWGRVFGILSTKPYRRGCYINPAKTLRESGYIR